MPELPEPVFKSAFSGPDEEALRRGRRPVIFDILAPDQDTSLLNLDGEGHGDLRLVLHVNPRSMQFSYEKRTERVQTRGGFVEFHWGDGAETVSFEAATGGFMRMYSGMSNITGFGSGDQGRRETIAYDKYLDLLALFHNNGAIYDALGNIVVQGYIKMTSDGGVHIGWFDGQFTVTEEASLPYMFNLSTRFIIDREIMRFRTANLIGYDGPTSVVTDLGGAETSTAILDENISITRPTTVNPFEGDILISDDESPLTVDPFPPDEDINDDEVDETLPTENVGELDAETLAGGADTAVEADPTLAALLSAEAGVSISQMGDTLTGTDAAAIETLIDATGFSQAQLLQILGL